MSASYPTSTKSFSTKTTGQTIAASHIDDLQDEVVAIEADLRAGLPVTRGGTGALTLTNHGVVLGQGTSAVAITAAGTTGQVLAAVTAGDPVFKQYAQSNTTVAAPTGTVSTSFKMMGLAGALTPLVSGRVRVTISGYLGNNTNGDGCAVKIAYGTGSAPANGDAATGTVLGTFVTANSAVGGQQFPFSITYSVTGLTLSTAYWVDAQVAAITGGTATIVNVMLDLCEF